MNPAKNLFGPPFFTSHFLNPEIEKILETTLTKENQRYYKVKWVKVTWEAEENLVYFSNIINQFWTQYTRECLLEPGNTEENTDNCQFNSTLNKDVYSFVTVPPNDIVPARNTDISEPNTSNLFYNASSTDILSMSSDADLLSPHPSGTESNVDAPTPDMLPPVINTNIFSDSCKATLNQFSADYTYSLNQDGNEFEEDEIVTAHTISDDDSLAATHSSVTESTRCIDSSTKLNNTHDIDNVDSTDSIVVSENIVSTAASFVPYKCSYCDAMFDCREKFLNHEKSHHDRKCTVCGKEFQRASHLKVHMNIHSDSRPFPCDQCEKSFRDKSSLVKHKLVHTNSRQHKCNLCEKSFNRAQHLSRHLESHQKIKHFQCTQCDKKFHQKDALKIHLNVHAGLKPYKCSICEESFSDGSTLRRHSFIHSKPFKCNICQKSFTRDVTLKNHCEKVHKDK